MYNFDSGLMRINATLLNLQKVGPRHKRNQYWKAHWHEKTHVLVVPDSRDQPGRICKDDLLAA